MDFKQYVSRHKRWSMETFGDSKRVEGVLKHIEKEVAEVRMELGVFELVPNGPAVPASQRAEIFQAVHNARIRALEEIIDIIILAIDAAWRLGFNPDEIQECLANKQIKNFQRKWPEIGTVPDDQPTEHIKE